MRRSLAWAGAMAFVAGLVGAEGEQPAIVVIALDTSGSIGVEDRARARDLALSLVESLPAGSETALLTFDDQSRFVVERTTGTAGLRDAIMATRSSGRFTALYDALYDASRYLRDAPGGRKAIVLLTDGRDENSALNLDDGLSVATGNGIPVFAVGMGTVEERTLRRIAKLTRGDYATLDRVSARTLAEAIGGPSPSPERGAPPPAEEQPPAAQPVAERVAGRGALRILIVGGVLTAALLLAFGLSRRRAPAAAPMRDVADEDPASSPTVIGRLESTEEYLEKTISLSETPVLVVQGGPHSGRVHVVSDRTATCIGRAKANDVVIDDVSVSAQHCRIRFEGGHFVLHDLQSTNGTFVNEQRVSRHVLKARDVVKLGETNLLFRMDRMRT